MTTALVSVALVLALSWAVFLTWRVRRHEEIIAVLLEDLVAMGLTHNTADLARSEEPT
jgi:hypothetical protein